jgi:uncharacterized spore protein YtfJ
LIVGRAITGLSAFVWAPPGGGGVNTTPELACSACHGAHHGMSDRREQTLEVQDVIAQARDAITVKRVFGEPYEKDGVTVIPAARVRGGAGGGGGEDAEGKGRGSGGGFGITAHPVGAFMIRDGELSWRPAVDVNRAILGGQVVAVVALLTLRAIVKARAKAKR